MLTKLLGLLGYTPKPAPKKTAYTGGSTGRTKKNIDIVSIIADKKSGLSNREIAKKNNVSEFTIRQRLKDTPLPITPTQAAAATPTDTDTPACGLCGKQMTYKQNARYGDSYYCKKCGNQISADSKTAP